MVDQYWTWLMPWVRRRLCAVVAPLFGKVEMQPVGTRRFHSSACGKVPAAWNLEAVICELLLSGGKMQLPSCRARINGLSVAARDFASVV